MEPQKDGGLGPLQTDIAAGSTHRASDLRLLERAVRGGWNIPAAKRPELVERAIKNATEGDVDESNKALGILAIMSREDRGVMMGAAKHIQSDRQHAEAMKREDDRNKIAALSTIPDAVLIEIAKAHNKLELLPPRLREIAANGSPADRR